jgi:hypothetical protein
MDLNLAAVARVAVKPRKALDTIVAFYSKAL